MVKIYDNQMQLSKNAVLWIERARRDYEAFKLIVWVRNNHGVLKKLVKSDAETYKYIKGGDPALLVYLLQQCVEKCVKSLAIASGRFKPEELKEDGHKSRKLLLKVWRTLIKAENRTNSSSVLPSILDLERLSEKDIWEVLGYIQNLRKEIMFTFNNVTLQLEYGDTLWFQFSVGKKHFEYVYAYDTSPSSIILEDGPPIHSGSTKLLDLALRFFVESSTRVTIAIDSVPIQGIIGNIYPEFSKRITLFSLLILAALTYRHEATSRYPNLPTIMKGTQGEIYFGCEDYTEKLAIVRHIDLVGELVGTTLSEVENMIEQITSILPDKQP